MLGFETIEAQAAQKQARLDAASRRYNLRINLGFFGSVMVLGLVLITAVVYWG